MTILPGSVNMDKADTGKREEDTPAPARVGGGEGYLLVRSRKRRRTISLELEEDGRAVIHAPWRTPRGEIDDFFRRKAAWLAEKRSEQERHRRENAPRAFLAGETFLFLGVPCPLEIGDRENGFPPLRFVDGCFVLNRTALPRARALFTAWYRTRAEEYLTRQVGKINERLMFPIRSMRIGDARYRWGSCSHTNRLSFTWRLIMAPPPVIDYVVVHELVHIREKNHSRRFWELLAETLPGYERQRTWLADRGHLLNF